MKKILIGIFIILLFIAGLFIFKNINGHAVSDEVQKITLSMKNYNYYPNTITVEVDKPVEITLDHSVGGCFRSFNIKDLGISLYSREPSDTIKFTPTKKGSFEFACGMHMAYGTIKVR